MASKPSSNSSKSSVSGKTTTKKTQTSAIAKSATGASAQKLAVKTPPSKLRQIFEGAGFKHVNADNIHFKVDDRTGEIDHIFVWENVVVLCEETTEAHPTGHCTNKIFFHNKIAQNPAAFWTKYTALNPALPESIGDEYAFADLEIRHVYFSEKADVSPLGDSAPLKILTRAQAEYFASLAQTIQRSAKYELLKYLDVKLAQIGKARTAGSEVALNTFSAFALPAAHTSYPAGFAVVSFYADPMALIQRAYVMRRDGWEDPDLSYQRFVRAEKLLEMREYLADNGKVFINNLVVTLPPTALITAKDSVHAIDVNSLAAKSSVNLLLPLELGTVGIVDGQHRILSYYEGSDATEAAIKKLRGRQNLLVTGIIFPPSYTPEMRAKFEAEIFLGINDNQTTVHTQLRQDLQRLINPETPLAIARSIILRLSKDGPLKGKLQMSQFDPSDLISSGSLGPYVVKTLIRRSGPLYKAWDSAGARDFTNAQDRQDFIDFCVTQLRELLSAAASLLKSRWASVPNKGVLSTTAVGGLILLLEHFLKEGKPLSSINFKKRMANITTFAFDEYTGSSWRKLAEDLHAAL